MRIRNWHLKHLVLGVSLLLSFRNHMSFAIAAQATGFFNMGKNGF